jgi:hypothetical protein
MNYSSITNLSFLSGVMSFVLCMVSFVQVVQEVSSLFCVSSSKQASSTQYENSCPHAGQYTCTHSHDP